MWISIYRGIEKNITDLKARRAKPFREVPCFMWMKLPSGSTLQELTYSHILCNLLESQQGGVGQKDSPMYSLSGVLFSLHLIFKYLKKKKVKGIYLRIVFRVQLLHYEWTELLWITGECESLGTMALGPTSQYKKTFFTFSANLSVAILGLTSTGIFELELAVLE